VSAFRRGPGAGGFPGPGRAGGDDAALRAMVAGTDARWAAAAVGSFRVSGLELATGKSVMAIGGFAGEDPSPTLAQFRRDVDKGEVRYFILGDAVGPGPGEDTDAAQITAWVRRTFGPAEVGGVTVYDLAARR
jgi:hypothetical protein